jgi:hypothetical protein
MKPTLKAFGITLLKLKYDEPLSEFAFKFNLRRYSKDRLSIMVVLFSLGNVGGRLAAGAASDLVVGSGRYCSPRHRMPFES